MAKKVSKAEFKKTAAKRTTDISQTQWLGGPKSGMHGFGGPKGNAGRLFGPKGKLFTGTVNLGGGKTAVYQQGKKIKPGAAPKTSRGSARTSTSTPVTETKKLPSTSTLASGYTTGASYTRSRGTSPVSGSSRLEGSPRSIPVSAPRTKAPIAGTLMSEKRRSDVVRKTGGFVRGVASSPTVNRRVKGTSLTGTLQRKRAEDTRNQVRNAVAIAAIPTVALGGAAAGASMAARVGISGLTRAAGQGLVSGARGATGQGSVRQAATKAASQTPKPASKPMGTTKGVSKVSGGALKGGQPAKYGPKKPTAAQAAASRRKAAAQKAAATRKANAAKAARGRKKP